MKKSRFFYSTILSVAVTILALLACSNDDDFSNEGILSKKLKAIHLEEVTYYTPNHGRRIMDYMVSYNDTGELSKMEVTVLHLNSGSSYTDVYKIEVGVNSISWGTSDKALFDNERVTQIKTNHKDPSAYIFTYDSRGRLIEISLDGGYDDGECYRATWDGNNVRRIERIKSDGEIVEWTEYSYTSYPAGMLSCLFNFNPYCEFDFFDTIGESAPFYTGLCGPLSQNLPSEKRSWSLYGQDGKGTENVNEILTMNYSYTIGSSGYPTHVTIAGYDFFDSAEKRLDLDIIWED